MPSPGRPPKPSAIKRLEGNPGRRALNDAEPQPDVALPPKPATLSPVAAAEWDVTGPLLVSLGVLTVADGQAFQAYCELRADWEAIGARLKDDPDPVYEKITIDGSGQEHRELKPNPLYAMRDRVAGRLLMYFARFGMTPSDRSKIIAPKPVAKQRKDSWAA